MRSSFKPFLVYTCSGVVRQGLGCLLTLLVLGRVSPAIGAASTPHTACLAQLDELAHDVAAGAAAARAPLESLANSCADLPQVYHNLAVLDAANGDWDAAKQQLERSIELDTRAAASLDALRRIHRWQAAEAYARALGGNGPAAPPQLKAQSSRDVNSDTRRWQHRQADLYDTATVDYELWEWWRSAAEQSRFHSEHYVGDASSSPYLVSASELLPAWDDVTRELRFVGQDAVAAISWTNTSGTPSNLVLLMRLHEQRWRIYDELILQ